MDNLEDLKEQIKLLRKQQKKQRAQENREKTNLYAKNYMNTKYNTDPDFREKVKERRRERYQLKKLELLKTKKTETTSVA